MALEAATTVPTGLIACVDCVIGCQPDKRSRVSGVCGGGVVSKESGRRGLGGCSRSGRFRFPPGSQGFFLLTGSRRVALCKRCLSSQGLCATCVEEQQQVEEPRKGLDDPAHGSDSIDHETESEGPRKVASVGLYRKAAHVKPSSLKDMDIHDADGDGAVARRSDGSAELLWRKYFEKPSDWWDTRSTKPHPNSPDFRHKRSEDVLWVKSSSTPQWVADALRQSTAAGSCHDLMAALKECGRVRDLESVKRIHAEAVERGCDSDVYVGTMLVDVYGKCRRLVEARAVFDQMPERNVVSWNAMMWAYAQMEDGEEALRLYRRMAQEGVAPTDRTFIAALKACCCSASGSSLVSGNEGQPVAAAAAAAAAAGVLKQVREVHWDMVKRSPRSLSAVYVGTMLVDAYAKCGSLVEARQVFDGMPHRDVVCWNVMILGYAQLEDGGKALELYAQMQASGVDPDERTFVAALKACCCCSSSSVPLAAAAAECQVRAIHSQVVKRGKGAETDVFVGTMLVDAYVKCGNLEAARRVFDAMPHRNVVSWTAMIWGYAHREEGEEALQLYWRMQEEGVAPDDRALVAALKACGSWLPAAGAGAAGGASAARMRQCLERVRRIHSDMGSAEKRGWDVFVGNMLVDVYAKCGSLADARRVFEAMPRRDVVSWTCIISGYAQMEDGATALHLFERMQEEEGVVPDARTFVGALKACSAVAGLDMGRRIHGRIIAQSQSGDLDLVLASSLIDMYCRCGSMAEAQQVFDALPGRAMGHSGAVCVWRALIAGYARQGDSDRVFHLLHLMLEQGEQQRKQQQQQQEGTSSSSLAVSVLAPDGAVWLSVLAVCSHAGLLEQGLSVFRAMMAHSAAASSAMDIGGEHYACVVDLLGRAGRLHDALAVARAAAAAGDGDGAVWRAVLSACRQWGDVEIGREAFRRAVEADQGDAAAYVLMANVYAAAGMWEEARQVQAARMKVGSWKQPGQSQWTDAQGGVHLFGVGGGMGMGEQQQQQQQLEVRLEVLYPQLHRLQAKMMDA